jgi:hypothetical protein
MCIVQEVEEKWIFSSSIRSFGYGYEAVRIGVQDFQRKIIVVDCIP